MGLFSFFKRKSGTDQVSKLDVNVEVPTTAEQAEKTSESSATNDENHVVTAAIDTTPVVKSPNESDAAATEHADDGITKEEIEQAKQDLDKSLNKTRFSFFERIAKAVVGKSKVDDEVLDNLEEILVTSDVGVETTLKIIKRIEERVARDKYVGTGELNRILREEIVALLQENNSGDGSTFRIPDEKKPYVIMVVGVNGVGKTTTIGKLAYNFKRAGFKVVLGASDTFRAAAVDQLKIWADRVGVSVVSQGMGADPASVAFDTVKSALAQDADVVIIDTAGRLHNKVGLMNELSKIKKVCQKVIPDAPHEVLLVLDASTGQNAIEQARQFIAATEVNAIALTKLDGTAKGGVVIGISDQFKIPVKYIGVGEKKENLQIFDRKEFVDSLFN
ncbi:MAG: signal recognition particle-docking protein FtsY [Bacteroidales bacterium]|nr:signal recognition particle-docking protein FtsY [Bacteroidales bacterium]MDY6075570.1 signal recognition particle-docking protein FtsY [Bacteroidales bacterium]